MSDKPTRKEKRDYLADKVCCEARYQLSKYGCIVDHDKLLKHVAEWMVCAKKDKYERP